VRPTLHADASSPLALRIPAFRRLLVAAFLFNVGHLFQVVASSWVVLELTGSPFWVSLTVGAPLLPFLLLSLPAGAAADLLDRRRVLVASSTVMTAAGATVLLLWLADAVTAGRLVVAGLAFGVGVAFFNPAWQAVIPSLVPRGMLPGAVALESASGGAATAIGPALGGVVVATAGPGWAFAAAAVGYMIILLAVASTDISRYAHDVGSMQRAIATGLRYVRFSGRYRWILVVGCLFGVSSAALRALLPSITSEVLDGGSALYGGLLAAFGAGALIGGLTRGQGRRLLGDQLVAWSIMLFGAAMGVVAASRSWAVTGGAMLVSGLLWVWILATLISTVQMLTPDWVRGRTMSVFISVFGLASMGAVGSGALGDAIGVPGSLLASGLTVVGLGVLASRIPLPVLERIEPPLVREHEFEDDGDSSDSSAPVMVVNTWIVDDDEFDEFSTLLDELRQVRLSTGAYQWDAYSSCRDARRVSEVFLMHGWQDVAQAQRRLDTHAVETIRRAAQFGRHNDTCVTECLIAFGGETSSTRNGSRKRSTNR
jgi:MFS family permease